MPQLYPYYLIYLVVCHNQYTTSLLKMQDALRKKFVEQAPKKIA